MWYTSQSWKVRFVTNYTDKKKVNREGGTLRSWRRTCVPKIRLIHSTIATKITRLALATEKAGSEWPTSQHFLVDGTGVNGRKKMMCSSIATSITASLWILESSHASFKVIPVRVRLGVLNQCCEFCPGVAGIAKKGRRVIAVMLSDVYEHYVCQCKFTVFQSNASELDASDAKRIRVRLIGCLSWCLLQSEERLLTRRHAH